MPSIPHLLRTIALLLVALMAPRGMLARVRGLDWVGLTLLARDLEQMAARGEQLRYPSESLKTVAARLDLLVWISADPIKALAHLARRARGWRRHSALGRVAPPTLAPARRTRAPVLPQALPPAFADSS